MVRDGRRYKVTEIERLAGPTAKFSFIDVLDSKSYSIVLVMSEQFFDDVDTFRKNRQNMPGMAFVIEMKKNRDGSGESSWEVMSLHDPADKRYT